MLRHRVTRGHVRRQANSELVVGVEIDFLLQLSTDVLVVICVRAQVLVKLRIGGARAM